MSLTVPITTSEMHSGVSGYSATPEQMTTKVASPAIGASVSAANNSISFAAAGWIAFGLGLVYAVHKMGFRHTHVPV